jgi:hypothetical protein
MITEFHGIPDFFIERYNEEMEAWGANFQKIGAVKSFVLKEGHWAEPSPDPEQGPTLIQVKLRATVVRNGFSTERAKVIVEPDTEEDDQKIRRHCERMQGLGVPSRLFTPEPPRPWLPFMPKIDTRKTN